MPRPSNRVHRPARAIVRLAQPLVWAQIAGALLLAGCAANEPPPPPLSTVGAAELARAAQNASMIDHPYRLEFEWTMTEPGIRLRGRGVARIEPPYRARVDLFMPNGERVAAAALVGDDMRLPAGLPSILPPPALFWATLGVFRPGMGAGLIGSTGPRTQESRLHYQVTNGELRYLLRGSEVHRLDLLRDGAVREEVRLTRAEGERFPREAVFRDLTQTRELRLTLSLVEQVEAYPAAVWDPGN